MRPWSLVSNLQAEFQCTRKGATRNLTCTARSSTMQMGCFSGSLPQKKIAPAHPCMQRIFRGGISLQAAATTGPSKRRGMHSCCNKVQNLVLNGNGRHFEMDKKTKSQHLVTSCAALMCGEASGTHDAKRCTYNVHTMYIQLYNVYTQ